MTFAAGGALLLAPRLLPTPHQASPPPPELAALSGGAPRPPAGRVRGRPPGRPRGPLCLPLDDSRCRRCRATCPPASSSIARACSSLAATSRLGVFGSAVSAWTVRRGRGAAKCPGGRRRLVGGDCPGPSFGGPGDGRQTGDVRRRGDHRLPAAPAGGLAPAGVRRRVQRRRLPRRGALDDRAGTSGRPAPHQPLSPAVAQHAPDALVLPRRPGTPARRQVALSVRRVAPAGRRPDQGVGPGP